MTRPALALAAIVAAGTVTYGSLGGLMRGPSVFADELIYMDATRSVAGGHAPQERDRAYGRGLLLPVLGAPVVALAPDQRAAYAWLKWFNAFLFSLAAVPVYALARRLLRPWWSVAVAALSVAVPSALYSGLVLTESAAYAAGSCALLALVLAVERPTARRQLVALGACALAALARPQLAALVFAVPVGLAVRWLSLPRSARPALGAALRRLWPTGAAVAIGALLWVAALASGHVTLKDYRDVWRGYSPLAVAKWSWYTVAELALYLAVIPAVVAPAALRELWRSRARRDTAFLGVFAAVNVVTVLLVAAFSSAAFGGLRLHDRYLFYVVPLWLVLFAVWLDRGAPAGVRSLVVGTALALVLVVTLPERLLVRDTNIQFDAVGTAIWARVRAVDPARPGVLRLLLAVAVLVALGAVVAARLAPFARVALLVPLVMVFVLNAVFVWENRVHDSDLTVFANGHPHTWSWVDAAVPSGRRVTDLFVDSAPCLPVNTSAFRWTEFFNERIGPVDRIGPPVRPGEVPDGAAVSIGADGVVRSTGGTPLRPGYVVTPPGLAVEGRELVRGTLDHLRLWRVDGVLRVRGAGSNADAIATACGGTSA